MVEDQSEAHPTCRVREEHARWALWWLCRVWAGSGWCYPLHELSCRSRPTCQYTRFQQGQPNAESCINNIPFYTFCTIGQFLHRLKTRRLPIKAGILLKSTSQRKRELAKSHQIEFSSLQKLLTIDGIFFDVNRHHEERMRTTGEEKENTIMQNVHWQYRGHLCHSGLPSILTPLHSYSAITPLLLRYHSTLTLLLHYLVEEWSGKEEWSGSYILT